DTRLSRDWRSHVRSAGLPAGGPPGGGAARSVQWSSSGPRTPCRLLGAVTGADRAAAGAVTPDASGGHRAGSAAQSGGYTTGGLAREARSPAETRTPARSARARRHRPPPGGGGAGRLSPAPVRL